MTHVTVYSAGPDCMQCRYTCKALEDARIEVDVVDLTKPESAEDRKFVTSVLGYSQAPVVVADTGQTWTGFRPDLIAALTHRAPAPPAHAPTATAARDGGWDR